MMTTENVAQEELVNFTVYVKHHIIDEYNNYNTVFEFMHSNVKKECTDTFKEYFAKSDILGRLGITDSKYRIWLDINQHHGIDVNCKLISILCDTLLMRQCYTPHGIRGATGRYLHIVPDQEIWSKYVRLDESQIEAAKKIMSDIEEQPFKKRKLDVR